MTNPNPPLPGERIHFDFLGDDTVIRVDTLHAEQPLMDDEIFLFVDQYGDLKMCESDGNGWAIVTENHLSPAQAEKVWDILYPSHHPAR